MTEGSRQRRDGVYVLHQTDSDRGDTLAAVVPARARQPLPASPAGEGLSNVIPFMRPRASDARGAVPEIVLPADAQRTPLAQRFVERWRMAAFAAVSLALHGSLALFLWREPPPLASIGKEVISVELVLGANDPVIGASLNPGAQERDQEGNETQSDPAEQQRSTDKATEQPQNVAVAEKEAAPEQTSELERQADEPQPRDNQAAETQQPAEPKPSVAMVESPQPPEIATSAPREIPPDSMDISLLPQPEQKPVETPPEPKPAQQQPAQKKPEPKAEPKQVAKPPKTKERAKQPTRVAAPTKDSASEESHSSVRMNRASGVGQGRSDNDTNYRGIVFAHLRRHQQYPSDARSRGDQGAATVTFALDGSGRVTSVRLTRGSGHGSLDQEAQAMVRRASPFPAPPSGHSVSFTAPISFSLR